MTPEDRLRQAIDARTSGVEPSADALHRIEEKLMEAQQHDNRNRLLIGLGAAAAIVAVVVGVLVLAGDDDDAGVRRHHHDHAATTTTTESTTTTEATTTTVTVPDASTSTCPVFPDPDTSQRFDDPVAVATRLRHRLPRLHRPRSSATSHQGDSRSGEVEVRPFAEGAPTDRARPPARGRHLVRDRRHHRLDPARHAGHRRHHRVAAGAHGRRPTPSRARSHVRLYVDGTQEPIAETFVTGRGDGVLGDFDGELEFTQHQRRHPRRARADQRRAARTARRSRRSVIRVLL